MNYFEQMGRAIEAQRYARELTIDLAAIRDELAHAEAAHVKAVAETLGKALNDDEDLSLWLVASEADSQRRHLVARQDLSARVSARARSHLGLEA
jgi:rubrerythrin